MGGETKAQGQPLEPCDRGYWEVPVDHAGNAPPISTTPACTPNPAPPPFHEFPATNTGFEAIHLQLLSVGSGVNPVQGHLLVINHIYYAGDPATQTRVVDWSIVDPVTWTFTNYRTCLPAGKGDLFCAGHTTMHDGKVLFAGGTEQHAGPPIYPISPPPPWPRTEPPPGNAWGGAKLVMVFDPTVAPGLTSWSSLADLNERRWYPSVLAIGKQANKIRYVVAGGTDFGQDRNSYQCLVYPSGGTPVWEPLDPAQPTVTTFPGPPAGVTFGSAQWFKLTDYPRIHLLSNGLAVTAGMSDRSARLDQHQIIYPINLTTRWEPGPSDESWKQTMWRSYGTSVLMPISMTLGLQDYVMSIGGQGSVAGGPNVPQAKVEVSHATQAAPANYWNDAAAPDLNKPRMWANSVLLPDGTVLVVGGEQTSTTYGCSKTPAYEPELYRGGAWRLMNATNIIRDYHSTALLLPDGRVLVASGESRRYQPTDDCMVRTPISGPADYQIYVPPYLACGYVRPVITNTVPFQDALLWNPGSVQMVTHANNLPPGVFVEKVVLARAGSVTHHCDPNQRVVALTVEDIGPGFVNVSVPSSPYVLPSGFYMLFLLTNAGTPSVAKWVKIP